MSDEKKIETLENSSVRLTLTLPASRIEEDYRKSLAKYSKTILLKGFRKGHAPTSVVEAKVGPAIRNESTFNTMEDFLKEEIEKLEAKDKPLPYSTPALQDEDKLLPFRANSDITFSVVYEVMPIVEIPQYTGLTVTYPKVSVTEEDVNRELDKLREQNAMVIDKKGAAEKGDIITVDYVEMEEDGSEKEETRRGDFTFTIGTGFNYYQFDDDVVGMSVGEEKVIEKSYPDDFKTTELASRTVKVKVTMKSVKTKDVPALDDDFAQDVKEEYKTVDDLTKATRQKLESDLAERIDEDRFNRLTDAIAEKTPFQVPGSMVDFELNRAWRNHLSEMGFTEEQMLTLAANQNTSKEAIFEAWRPDIKRNLKLQLILEEIEDKENLTATKEEVDAECEKRLKDIDLSDSRKESYREMCRGELSYVKIKAFLEKNNEYVEEGEKSLEEYLGDVTGNEERT